MYISVVCISLGICVFVLTTKVVVFHVVFLGMDFSMVLIIKCHLFSEIIFDASERKTVERVYRLTIGFLLLLLLTLYYAFMCNVNIAPLPAIYIHATRKRKKASVSPVVCWAAQC